MLVVHIDVRVKPDQIEAFRQATIENARASVKEPGIARFDIIQSSEDPSHFVFLEVYRTEEGRPQHRQTAHYLKWRDTVESMMAEPRKGVVFSNVFPDDTGW